MKPLVSVIIPAFNAERWIEESVESALRQTWTDIEVIVVDDGSSDRTVEIADSIADQRLCVIRAAHAGAAAARNIGLAKSRGAFVEFLDADDVLGADKIAAQMSALENEPQNAIASATWKRFTGDASSAEAAEEPVWTIDDPVEWLVVSLGGGGMMQPAAWLTPRAVIEAAGPWNESLSLHDDGEYFTRVLLQSPKNVFVREATVFYRDVEGSLSRQRSREALVSALAVCRLRAAHLLASRDDSRVRQALATQYAQFAYETAKTAPDLSSEALTEIERLRAAPSRYPGGQAFSATAATLGLRKALALRRRLKR